MQIGAYRIENPVVLAPMAGVTDAVFRKVCLDCGAGLAFGEMVASNPELRKTEKTKSRFAVSSTEEIPVIQILGADPFEMAEAALYAQNSGAKIVDVNFGCPARVVCGKACGSALMGDVKLATRILEAVKAATTILVTVKMRTGWDEEHKTVLELAKAAEEIGFSAVTVHGRTRRARFTGPVDYETIGKLAQELKIPVIANGDIDSGEKALAVMKETGAAGVMVGRASLGAPWIFREISDAIARKAPQEVTREEKRHVILTHWKEHCAMFGCSRHAVRMFRKHALWYLSAFAGGRAVAQTIFGLDDAESVTRVLEEFLTKDSLWIA